MKNLTVLHEGWPLYFDGGVPTKNVTIVNI